MNKIDPSKYSDRLATEKDLKEILNWLANDPLELFKGCEKMIETGQQENRLLVLIEKRSCRPVAFCLGGLTDGGGIFIVQSGTRATMDENTLKISGGKGVGTRLFECCLERAKSEGKVGLFIQCRPENSVEFWEKCGFQILDDESSHVIKAVYPIPRQFKLPKKRKTVPVTFQLKHECDEEWKACFNLRAEMLEDGMYQLQSRFVKYVPNNDFLIRILIDGMEINNNKIKGSTDCGVEYHDPFVVVDKIIESQSEQ